MPRSHLPSILELRDSSVVDAETMAGELRSLLEKRAREPYSTTVVDDDGNSFSITINLPEVRPTFTISLIYPMLDVSVICSIHPLAG